VKRLIVTRGLMLLVTGVSLYLLAPSLLQTFSSWPELRGVDPVWFGLAIVFEAASFVAVWTLQRIAFRTPSWFAVGTSQLASSAAGRIVPGGGATASAIQYGLLLRSGAPAQTVASGMAATWAATTATAFALPVIASVAAIGGAATPGGLRQVAYIGGAAFLALGALAAAAFLSDRPLRIAGRGAAWAIALVRRRERSSDLSERLLRERDAVRHAFEEHPLIALLAAVGRWGFDYLALVCVLAALGLEPEPALVLLAYSATALLGMIPLTPGGLGFVEAGLAGLLVLAGVGAGDAAVATLAYRLISFWLPLPAGAVAYWLGRRRYSSVAPSVTSETASSPP
jgi:uncharacterized protein (TIRG00374 family)